jgi:hypothetical protein
MVLIPQMTKRAPNRYHFSVLAVLLGAFTLPGVPQNQLDGRTELALGTSRFTDY